MQANPEPSLLRRRAWLGGALGALALGGCGFALRGAPHFAFKSIYLAVPQTELERTLERQLQGLGSLKVLTRPEERAQADVVLESAGEQRRSIIVARDSNGQVRELELHLTFSFRLVTPQGKELIPTTLISREMDQSYDESAALSKDEEANMLYKSMGDDIVQQVLRRLATVK